MSDLPTRARVAELGCSASSPEEAEDIESILNAYRVGRLFDREAIDYEWAIGWIEAGFNEFLVGAKEHDEEYAKLAEFRKAIGDTG